MNDLLRLKVVGALKRDEGLRLTIYQDTEGVPTIGYGHNLRTPISLEIAEAILHEDLRRIEGAVEHLLPWISQLSEARQGVLFQMAFNLGPGALLTFRAMLAALKEADFRRAGIEMLDSVWAKQVGDRAVRLAQQMVDDKWG